MTDEHEITITIKRLPITEEAVIHGVCKRFKEKLQPVIEEKLAQIADGAFKEAIDRKADELLAEVLNRPLRKTNSWGEPTGEPTTLSTFIADRFESFMKQRVGTDGTPRDGGKPRTEWLIEKLGSDLVLTAAKAEIAKVSEAAKAQISAAVGNFIAQSLGGPAIKQITSPTPKQESDIPF